MRFQCVAALAVAAMLAGTASRLAAAEIVLVPLDDAGEGFFDPTPVAPSGGNPGTTLGAQRLEAFRAAAEVWGAALASTQEIRVAIQMDPLECGPTLGVLGSARAANFFREVPNGIPATWYPAALADAVSGVDNDPSDFDILATFSSALDDDPDCLTGITWSYALSGAPPPGTLPFTKTVEHELAHGLGFATVVDLTTGQPAVGLDDVYMRHLEDHSLGRRWPEMTDGERRLSAVDRGDLHWTGENVTALAGHLVAGVGAGGHVLMYAPPALELGSSVSHWDTSLLPDELMEPFATEEQNNLVTTALLADIGWTLAECVADGETLCLNGARFSMRVEWSDFAGNSGSGDAVVIPGVGDSGLFTFFDPDNLEILGKVLDGCAINNHFWVFAAATTNVEYTLTVTDTATGVQRTYQNALGEAAPAITDTAAFATCSPGAVRAPETAAASDGRGVALPFPAPPAAGEISRVAASTCLETGNRLCLQGGRFAVGVTFRDFQDRRGEGEARTVPGVGDSGLFTFFDPGNLELLIKVLDGCGINDRFWVFFAATTDVEFEVTVTDTETGAVRTYSNPLGQAARAVTDIDAFATCSP